jgi:hypothetical protein
MNNSITMDSRELTLVNNVPLDAALAFLAARSKKSSTELSSSASEVFKGIAQSRDQLLVCAIAARTSSEFEEVFAQSFPKYFQLSFALSNFARAVVPQQVLERLRRESVCELEADFREKALTAFGSAVREQALFAVWTLRKINELMPLVQEKSLEAPQLEEDREYSAQFNFHALRAQFSLDCLNTALRCQRPIYPEVMPELEDGLRSMVNAYTWIRRGAEIRNPSSEFLPEAMNLDGEEEDLLAASMQDMADMWDDDEPSLNGD